MIHDNDSMTLKVSQKPSAPNAANRYRVKFGPGSMGIKLVDRPEEEETGVYVKGLVEGGKGAMTHKIKVGDLLILTFLLFSTCRVYKIGTIAPLLGWRAYFHG